jgi:hypothetical protein
MRGGLRCRVPLSPRGSLVESGFFGCAKLSAKTAASVSVLSCLRHLPEQAFEREPFICREDVPIAGGYPAIGESFVLAGYALLASVVSTGVAIVRKKFRIELQRSVMLTNAPGERLSESHKS